MFQDKLSQWLRYEFKLNNLLPSLTAGAVVGVSEVIFAVSLGSLVFSGKLAGYFPYGVGVALVTAVSVMIVTALTSQVAGVIGSAQDSSSVILAVIAAALVSTAGTASAQSLLATFLVAISLTTLLTGVALLALGSFKLGGLVR